jgi:hypothetical protein
MQFKKGFKIKPDKVQDDGVILFTDGTNNDIYASEVACKAYGYDYKGGLCRAYAPSSNITKLQNLGGKSQSSKDIPTDTRNTVIKGVGITLKGDNAQLIINGDNHNVEQSIKNSSILAGKGGTIRAHGESVLVAQHLTDVGLNAQCSVVMLSCSTSDNTTTTMTNQVASGKTTETPIDYIPLPSNSIVGIEMYITRLETGGSSGTAGNYSYRRQQSCVKIDQNGVGTLVNFNTKNIAKIGVNGTMAITGITDNDYDGNAKYGLTVNVSDRNNVSNSWSAVLYLHITQTNTDF